MFLPHLNMTDTEFIDPGELLEMPDGTFATRAGIDVEFGELVNDTIDVQYSECPEREYGARGNGYPPFFGSLVSEANALLLTVGSLSRNDPQLP